MLPTKQHTSGDTCTKPLKCGWSASGGIAVHPEHQSRCACGVFKTDCQKRSRRPACGCHGPSRLSHETEGRTHSSQYPCAAASSILSRAQSCGMVRSGGEVANSKPNLWKFGKTRKSLHCCGQRLERAIQSSLSRSPMDARSSKPYRQKLKSNRAGISCVRIVPPPSQEPTGRLRKRPWARPRLHCPPTPGHGKSLYFICDSACRVYQGEPTPTAKGRLVAKSFQSVSVTRVTSM